MTNLLFEIGTEEIPAGYITPALDQMKTLFGELVKKYRLEVHSVCCAGTPRKLVFFGEGLPQKQENILEDIQGPAAAIAFDKAGNPTRAGIGFAKSQGVDIKELQIKKTPKGEYCFIMKRTEGQDTRHLLPDILREIVKGISFPKSMKWKENHIFFARPIRSLLALFGDTVVPVEMNGIKADRYTFGHPFLSGKRITIPAADWELYKRLLRQEKVVVDIDERREAVRAKIVQLMKPYDAVIDDEELLEEVTNLIEYPNAIECSFDKEFLDIPAEVVETAMKEHQRYFPVKKSNGKLIEKFVAVLNRNEDNADTAIRGNERVLKARLSDARFFWKEDRKIRLEKRVEDLKTLSFLEKLGNYYDRTRRIVALSDYIAHTLVTFRMLKIDDIVPVKRAALLCKADLVTQMVGEFPSLQGIMGREYAEWDGEEPSVAAAIAEHYMPRFAADTIPSSKIGAIVGLADKFDTISSCFALGLIPTGSQDPYSLRRHAYGILRIIEEHEFPLGLTEVLSQSLALLPLFSEPGSKHLIKEKTTSIREFFKDRLFHINIERGYRYDLVNAVLNAEIGFDGIHDFLERLKVISDISQESWWPDLVTVVERTFNIGKKVNSGGSIYEDAFTEPEEHILWDIYKNTEADIRKKIDEKKYKEASYEYCRTFAKPVHIFFDKVFVNVEDERIRNNRLMLLKKINELYSSKIADLSQIIMPDTKTSR
ncbi:MAG: glycine--tRNA ligase subunit beta [wastewater metagenome]|nr:glycine--tRNA ligase subunit beta [Candidatus Loosdrechtia aerotolerans]